MGEELVLWFEEIGRECVPMVGGKSANLGEMIRKGIPVPFGFAITTKAYDRFMKETGAAQEINRYIGKSWEGPKGVTEYQKISGVIRQIIESKEIPLDIREALGLHYNMLCERSGVANVRVAVRSSGVAEDSASSSFAGQFESFLNVSGEKDLLNKMKECWSSQFTTRAITYRIKKKLPNVGSSMCVCVQKMVNARSAGVGFTVHPITGDSSKIMLEGDWGLGESVVQGIVVPDRYIIDKQTLNLVEKKISNKEKFIASGTQGNVIMDVPVEKRQLPCFSEAEAMKIAEFAKVLESHYGMPQDVEWAIDSDLPFPKNIFLVQTRPITISMKKGAGEHTEYLVGLMLQMFRQIRESSDAEQKNKLLSTSVDNGSEDGKGRR